MAEDEIMQWEEIPEEEIIDMDWAEIEEQEDLGVVRLQDYLELLQENFVIFVVFLKH